MTVTTDPSTNAAAPRQRLTKGTRAHLTAQLGKLRKVAKAQQGNASCTDIISRKVPRMFLKRAIANSGRPLRVSRACLHSTRTMLVAFLDRLLVCTADLMTLTTRTHVPASFIEMAAAQIGLPAAPPRQMVRTKEAMFEIKRLLGVQCKELPPAPAPKSRLA